MSALQLANEPALGPPGIFDAEINRFYMRSVPHAGTCRRCRCSCRSCTRCRPSSTFLPQPPRRVRRWPVVLAAGRSSRITTTTSTGSARRVRSSHGRDPPRACMLEAELEAHEVDEYAAHGQKIITGEVHGDQPRRAARPR